MTLGRLVGWLTLASTLAIAAPAYSNAPKPLLMQVQRLVQLLRDTRAEGYPEATLFQLLKSPAGDEIALVVFTIEGFGGGNNHTQYLAAFTPETDGQGKQHFTLIDVMRIGGKGWRAVHKLDARTTQGDKAGEMTIAIDALEGSDSDAPNFPSKKTTINLVLRNGRLYDARTQ